MGYIKHNTIVCTGYKPNLQQAHEKAKELFGWRMVTSISKEQSNGYQTFAIFGKPHKLIYPRKIFGFVIIPDGSKEGWETSSNNDDKREEFFLWLDEEDRMISAVDVRFGGDDDDITIDNSY